MKLWSILTLMLTVITNFITLAKESTQSSQLKVSIYYESLCPYSKLFIKRQLHPAYQKIGGSLLIDLVPYGKATHVQEDGKWRFECQHGPKECWGNKAQACGLGENKGQDKNVNFINCVMSRRSPASEAAIRKCAPKLGVDRKVILECAKNRKGDELLAKLGDQTHAVEPKISKIPTIIFNDKYDSKLNIRALINFLSTACRLFDKKPAGCRR